MTCFIQVYYVWSTRTLLIEGALLVRWVGASDESVSPSQWCIIILYAGSKTTVEGFQEGGTKLPCHIYYMYLKGS